MKNESNKKILRFLPIILAVVGLVAGYSYYYFIGCQSGTCGITSNAFLSTAAGGLAGFFVGNIFLPEPEGEHDSSRRTGG